MYNINEFMPLDRIMQIDDWVPLDMKEKLFLS